MSTKSVVIAGIVAVVLLIAAGLSVMQGSRSGSPEAETEEVFFPGLEESINEVSKIEIRDNNQQLTLVKQEDHWGLEEKNGYPVNFDQVRSLVIDLAQMKKEEAKTTSPDSYSRIQVEDISSPEAQSKQVSLYDAEGNEMASLIVGKTKTNRGGSPMSPGAGSQQFIRQAGEAQSWLADRALQVQVQDRNWLNTDLMNIAGNRIQEVVITHPDGEEVRGFRAEEGGQMELTTKPEEEELASPSEADTLAGIFRSVRFRNVTPLQELNLSETEPIVATAETFDGLKVTAKVHPMEEGELVTFEGEVVEEKLDSGEETSGEEEDNNQNVREEAENINRQYGDWAYALPGFVLNRFKRTNEDFLAQPESETAGGEGPAPQSPGLPEGMPLQVPGNSQ